MKLIQIFSFLEAEAVPVAEAVVIVNRPDLDQHQLHHVLDVSYLKPFDLNISNIFYK